MQVTTTTYVVKKETRLSLPKSDMIFYLASLIRVFLCPTRKYRVLSRKIDLCFIISACVHPAAKLAEVPVPSASLSLSYDVSICGENPRAHRPLAQFYHVNTPP